MRTALRVLLVLPLVIWAAAELVVVSLAIAFFNAEEASSNDD